MSAQKFEAFLAKLYVDEETRWWFLTDPYGQALRAGLSEEECTALTKIDAVGLELAAHSYAQKRNGRPVKSSAWQRWLNRLGRIYCYQKKSGRIESCNRSA